MAPRERIMSMVSFCFPHRFLILLPYRYNQSSGSAVGKSGQNSRLLAKICFRVLVL